MPSIDPNRAAMPTIAIGCRPARRPAVAAFALRGCEPPARPTHSSISTCALIPPKPNPLTAARRGLPCPPCRPGLGPGENAKRAFVQAQLGCRTLEVRRRRQGPVLEGQQDLEQPGRAGGRQRVADIRFHRADRALPRAPAGFHPRAISRLSTSTASPTAAPVAWHSTRSTSGGTPARLLIGHAAWRGAGLRCWVRASRRDSRSIDRPKPRARKCGRRARVHLRDA